MINKKNRLKNLLAKSQNFDQFVQMAINRSSWFLSPYVQAGENVNRPWIEAFWILNKKGA